MKLHNIIFPLAAATLLFTGCYDEKMEWQRPDNYGPVVSSEIPLALAEQIANYKNIKDYMAEYMPGVPLGIGVTEAMLLEDEAYAKTVQDNFTMLTPGNLMKEGVAVKNDGTINFAAIDPFIAKAGELNMPVYGHCFVWHTQANSTYLTSLVAPKVESTSTSEITNMLTGDDANFDGGTYGYWNSWGGASWGVTSPGEGNTGSCIELVNATDNPGSPYSAQFAYTFNTPLTVGKSYVIRFRAKSSIGAGSLQFAAQNNSTYTGEGYNAFPVGTDWTTCQYAYTCAVEGENQILINFAAVAATYYIDNIEFGEGSLDGGVINTYTFKTPEEKATALTTAMHDYIFGMAEAYPTVTQWDVVNEPIADGSNALRGVDGKAFSEGDATPVEDPATGLTMNWASGTWYWGYYLGKDYGVQAFKMAREALGGDAILYINDYNLEIAPSKLEKLIEYVNYIEANGGQVDGIGTQMHVKLGQLTRAQIDAMFIAMAATGKLVRISELDIALGTATPTEEQYMQQSDLYKDIVESYKANVPAAQQGGICLWGLSDSTTEHEFWIPNDAPNLFDKEYARKIAYKGFCDGVAGKDLGEEFTGEDWNAGN